MDKIAERGEEMRMMRERRKIKVKISQKASTSVKNNRANRKKMDNRILIRVAIITFGHIINTGIVDMATTTGGRQSVINELEEKERQKGRNRPRTKIVSDGMENRRGSKRESKWRADEFEIFRTVMRNNTIGVNIMNNKLVDSRALDRTNRHKSAVRSMAASPKVNRSSVTMSFDKLSRTKINARKIKIIGTGMNKVRTNSK